MTVYAFNYLPNREYSNVFIAASFSGETSFPVKN